MRSMSKPMVVVEWFRSGFPFISIRGARFVCYDLDYIFEVREICMINVNIRFT